MRDTCEYATTSDLRVLRLESHGTSAINRTVVAVSQAPVFVIDCVIKKKKKKSRPKNNCSWPHFGAWQNNFIAVVRVESLYLEYWARNPTGDVFLFFFFPSPLKHLQAQACISKFFSLYCLGQGYSKQHLSLRCHQGITSRARWKSLRMNLDFSLKPFHACHFQNNDFNLCEIAWHVLMTWHKHTHALNVCRNLPFFFF